MPKICQRCAKDVPKICQTYVKHIPKKCPRYVQATFCLQNLSSRQSIGGSSHPSANWSTGYKKHVSSAPIG